MSFTPAPGSVMSQKQINSLNALPKYEPALRYGTEADNLFLGDLLGPMAFSHVAVAPATLAAATTTTITSAAVANALVGDLVVVVLKTLGTTPPAAVSGSVSATGTVVLTPNSTPGDATTTCSILIFRAANDEIASHSQNPGA